MTDEAHQPTAAVARKRDPVLRRIGPELPVADAAALMEREFSALYVRMFDALLRYAIAELRDADAAADVVQGCFASLWANYYKEKQEPPDKPEAIAYQAVLFRVKNFRRDRVRRAGILGKYLKKWGERARNWMLPDMLLEHGEVVTVVDEALREMTPRAREVFLLRRESEMPLQEIAELTGVSITTIKTLMGRAQKTLRDHVDKKGFGKA